MGNTDYPSKLCTSISSCTDCINYVNSGLTDTSKCVPIQPATNDQDFLGASITCASWSTVQSKKYTINYQCNNAAIPSSEKSQISDLRYNVKWAFYAYDAKTGDTLLKDMKIFTSTLYESRVVMGYDAGRNYLIASFRGSSNVMNWISNANFPKTAYTNAGCNKCSVHTGFLNSYNALAPDVKSYLAVLAKSYPSARVVVTGHSLGAAQAVLAAIDIKQYGYTPYLYDYGSPRVGEVNFATFLDGFVTATNLRAVYLNDPVPNLPPVVLGFVHGGTEIHFYDCSQYLADPAFEDDGQVFDLSAVADHSDYPCIATSVPTSSYY